MYFDDSTGTLYTTGFISVPGEATNIWIAKYDSDLVLLKNVTLNGSSNGEDVGYTIASDGSFLFIIGYVTETGEDHNIWVAKYDMNLVFQKAITINGPGNSVDDGYGILLAGNDLFIAGTVTTATFGNDIYLGKFTKDLVLQSNFTLNGPANSTDKGRFLALDEEENLFVSGSMSQVGTNYDIWLGKFDKNLNLLDDTIIAGPTTGEDKGYSLFVDELGTVFVVGTLTEPSQSYNLWLAKFDSDLTLLLNITTDGPAHGEDVGYSLILNNGFLYLTGVYTESVGGENILLAKYNKSFKLLSLITVSSPGNNYDTGYGIILGPEQTIFVSGFFTMETSGPNIWLAQYNI
jgi:hypothetical protein